ncbi:hypothetical protein MFLAVUS_009672 [Mucor flavus]|uniref:Uncharacterized protein n=1 Tax=Mucor flavus TaxID=439312 RepID=A0ABP9ZAJ3_9FUNG
MSDNEQEHNITTSEARRKFLNSVGSTIKTNVVNIRHNYHLLTAYNKAIVMLGLNYIIDLSFIYPNSQSTLFTSQQWDELRKKYKPKKYNSDEYSHIPSIINPIFMAYNEKKPFQTNWINMYKQVKLLEQEYDPELDPSCGDIFFCWDYIVKFWGLIAERLFYNANLRLKCDTISDGRLKVDMRILNDKTKQRYNFESDISVMEASEEYPGDAKFISDRCKLSIENKTIIDRFLVDGIKITSVDSLQISGLEVFFINACLEEPGLYVTTELNRYKVDKTYTRLYVKEMNKHYGNEEAIESRLGNIILRAFANPIKCQALLAELKEEDVEIHNYDALMIEEKPEVHDNQDDAVKDLEERQSETSYDWDNITDVEEEENYVEATRVLPL